MGGGGRHSPLLEQLPRYLLKGTGSLQLEKGYRGKHLVKKSLYAYPGTLFFSNGSAYPGTLFDFRRFNTHTPVPFFGQARPGTLSAIAGTRYLFEKVPGRACCRDPVSFFSNRYDPVPFAKGYRVTGIGGKGTGSLQVQQHGTLFAGGIFAEKGYRGSHIGEKGTGVRKEPNTVPFREIRLRGEQFPGIGQIWSLGRRGGGGSIQKKQRGEGYIVFLRGHLFAAFTLPIRYAQKTGLYKVGMNIFK